LFLQVFIPEDPVARSESVRVKLGDLFGKKDQTLTKKEREKEIEFGIEDLRRDSIEAITSSNLQVPDSSVPPHAFENPERPKVKRHEGGGSTIVDAFKNIKNINKTTDNSNNINFHFSSDVSLRTWRRSWTRSS